MQSSTISCPEDGGLVNVIVPERFTLQFEIDADRLSMEHALQFSTSIIIWS